MFWNPLTQKYVILLKNGVIVQLASRRGSRTSARPSKAVESDAALLAQILEEKKTVSFKQVLFSLELWKLRFEIFQKKIM